MTGKDILERTRRILDDVIGETTDKRWSDAYILDDAANDAQEDLCELCRGLIVDSTTAKDAANLPICTLPVTANIQGVTSPYVATYAYSPYVLEIVRVKFALQTKPTPKTTSAELDANWTNWQGADPGSPKNWSNDMNSKMITFTPPPSAADTANLTVWRLPLVKLSKNTPDISPEIPMIYHKALIPRILQYCFEENDEETFRPKLAEKYEQRFIVWVERIKRELINQQRTVSTNSTRKAFT